MLNLEFTSSCTDELKEGDKARFLCARIARALYRHIMTFGFACSFIPINKAVTVLTALGDCSGRGEVSVLAVHVVGATAGVVTQPDAKVFHLQGRFLVNL